MLESKRRAIIFLTLSFVLALAAGFFVLQKVKALNADLGGMTEIYVAAGDIPSRTIIQPDQLKTMDIPNRFLTDSHVVDAKQLAGKVLVVPLSEGDIITNGMVNEVSQVRDGNNRLVNLYFSEKVRFDEQLKPLDRVDIIVSHQFEGDPKTETFMKDVTVNTIIKKDGKFAGVGVEIAAGDAPGLIHMQNYADNMRILKANVGKADQNAPKVEANTTADQSKTDSKPAATSPEKQAEKAKTQQPKDSAESKTENPKKEDSKNASGESKP